MSNVVEERVVQMEFDNKDFEKNIAQSQKSLNLFQTGLAALAGATTGIGAFAYQLKGLTFDPINNGIHIGIGKMAQFAAVFTGVSNIANEVYTRIMQTVGQLSTLRQFDAGFQKYEEKTSSVQTIMAAVRKEGETEEEAMARVNGQMEKLNWFTDETSYSFVDMVNNIGKFTSQGMELDKSVTAMQGIATWAAKSGAGVTGASRAMYNLSQALGMGAVKLQDWNSIENANMSTKEFKEQAMEAAVAVGTLRKENGKYYDTLKGDEVTVQNFSHSLASNWFSSDALMKVLETYGSYADLVHDAQKDGELASETMRRLAEEGKNAGYELGESAFKAAQEAKTFTEAIEATKDAMGTSFLNIFETIFGNYLEAKELWTGFAELLYDVFVTPLEVFQKMANTWKQLQGTAKIFRGFENIVEAVYNVTDKFSEQFTESFGNHNIVNTLGTLATAFENLSKYLITVSENIADNETIWKNFDKFFKGLIGTFQMLQDVVSKLYNKIIKPVFKALAEEGPETLSEIIGSVGIFLKQLSDLYFSTDALDKVLENTSEIILFIFEQLREIGSVAKTAFDSIFAKKLNASEISGLVSPLETLKDIFKEFISFVSTAIKSVIPSLISVFGWLKRLVGQIIEFVKEIWPNIKGVLENIKQKFIDLGNSVKNFLDNSNPFERIKNAFTGIIGKIKEFFGQFKKTKEDVDNVTKTKDANKPNFFEILAHSIGRAIIFMANIARKHGQDILLIRKILLGDKSIDEVIVNISKALLNMAESIAITIAVLNVAFGAKGFISTAKNQLFGSKGFFPMLHEYLSQKLPKVINPFKGMMNDFGEIMKNFSKDIISTFKTMSTQKTIIAVIHELGTALLKLAAAMLIISLIHEDEDRFVASFGALIGIIAALTAVIAGLFKVLDDSTKNQATSQNGETSGKLMALTGFLVGISTAVIVMAGALAIISSVGDWKQALQGLLGIAGILGGLVGLAWSINDVDGKKLIVAAAGMILVSKAVLNISKAIKTIGKVGDTDKALAAMGIIGAILGGLVIIMTLASTFKAEGKNILGILAIETLLIAVSELTVVMTTAVIALSKMTDPEKAFKALTGMAQFMLVLATFIGALAGVTYMIRDAKQIASLAIIAMIVNNFSEVLIAMAGALRIMTAGNADPDAMLKAADAINILMLAMSVVIASSALLSTKGVGGIFAVAGAFTLMSLGLLSLVPVLKQVSTMNIGQIALALLGLVGALGLLIGAGAIMTVDKSGMMATNLMKFAGAVMMLGSAALLAGAGIWFIADGFEKISDSIIRLTEIGPDGLANFERNIEVFSKKIPDIFGSIGTGIANLFVKAFSNRAMVASGIVNVVHSLAMAIKQAFPQIKETFKLVMEELLEFLREFMPKVNSFLYDVVSDLNNYILDILNRDVPRLNEHLANATWDLFMRILQLLNKGVPLLNEELAKEGMNLIYWVNELLKYLAKTILQGTIDILTMIRDNIGEIIALTVEIANTALFGLVEGMIETVPLLYDKCTELLEELLGLFEKILDTDWDKVEAAIDRVLTLFVKAVDAWIKIETKAGGVLATVGKNLVLGLISGIYNAIGDTAIVKYNPGTWIGNWIVKGFKKKMKIESPSKVMEQLGMYCTEGLSNGITKGKETLSTVAGDLGNIITTNFTKNFGTTEDILGGLGGGLLDGLKSTWSGFDFGGMLGNFTNLNPTITPSLDLSTLKSQVGGIDTLFANKQISAISSSGMFSTPTAGADTVTRNEQMTEMMDKFKSYLAIQSYNDSKKTDVNVTLAGDAKDMLKVLSVENTKQTKATGINQLVNQFG